MPELPDLEIIKEFLAGKVVGQSIVSVEHAGALVVRNLLPGDVADTIRGCSIESVDRYGKFLLFGLGRPIWLVINFMLTGRLMYCAPKAKLGVRTFLVLNLSGSQQLRYTDATQMGKIYLTGDLAKVPTFSEQGPDALSPDVSLEVFRQRLRSHPGEIKSTLTNQTFLAGIGNAYADEILYRARIYPFSRRKDLSAADTDRLNDALHAVLSEAIMQLRDRMGSNIHEEIRDFLLVHGKTGQPCPRCGNPISQVAANQRVTNFCRTCQPGTLIRQG